jgi:hypothetical protein
MRVPVHWFGAPAKPGGKACDFSGAIWQQMRLNSDVIGALPGH